MADAFDSIYVFFRSSAQQLPINNLWIIDGTMAIGLSFIGLAYFWHPRIETAYRRMRAYRAWRAIEKRQAVEVTECPTLTEVFGRQGMCACDAARITAVALLAFNFASWGLELNMDLYALDNSAWLLTQPPPIRRNGNSEDSTWIVLALDKIRPDSKKGDEVLMGLDNVFDNNAKSLYRVQDLQDIYLSSKYNTTKEGDVIVADWNPGERPSTLSYADADGVVSDTVWVNEIGCSGVPGEPRKNALIETENETGNREPWGKVMECEEGPKLVNQANTTASQPAIILTNVTQEVEGKTYVIVEERAIKLSFLYSVWWAPSPSSLNLTYSFHISSTVRLAEAVVTGIVNDKPDGKSCFSLLRAYSMNIDDTFVYGDDPKYADDPKASPFGENPKSGKVDSLQEVETIEAGVDVNNLSMICFVLVVVLSVSGIAWSFFLRSSIPIDVYDRDALIRAVSLQGQSSTRDLSSTKPSAIRIFVRKEDSGKLTVVVSDAGDNDDRSGLKRLFRRGGTVVETTDPAPVADTFPQYNDGFGGVPVPVGPRTVWLGGVRTGMGRSFPGREGNFHYPDSVALSASPVPSDVGESFARTPVTPRSPLSSFVPPHERRNSFQRDGRGPSVLFDSVRSLGSGGSGSTGSAGSEERIAPTKTNGRQKRGV